MLKILKFHSTDFTKSRLKIIKPAKEKSLKKKNTSIVIQSKLIKMPWQSRTSKLTYYKKMIIPNRCYPPKKLGFPVHCE